MGKRVSQRERERAGRRLILLAVIIILVVLAGGGLWLWLGREGASGGTPRLAVDRTEADLGYRRFETPVRVVFTLTNAGDSPLRLTEVPRVKAVAGC